MFATVGEACWKAPKLASDGQAPASTSKLEHHWEGQEDALQIMRLRCFFYNIAYHLYIMA
jgi:hypothetical protein